MERLFPNVYIRIIHGALGVYFLLDHPSSGTAFFSHINWNGRISCFPTKPTMKPKSKYSTIGVLKKLWSFSTLELHLKC